MHVLHVINQMTAHGGAEVSLREMLLGLQQAGVACTLQPLKDGTSEAAVERLSSAGVRVLPPIGSAGASAVPRLLRVLRDERPDVLHTSLFEADLWGRLAAVVTRTPVVVSLVNTQYDASAYEAAASPRRLRVVQAVDGFMARHLTTALHAISESAATAAVSALAVSRARVVVVPRSRPLPSEATRTRLSKAAARERAGLPPEVPMILNVARQEPQKGQEQLVSAFARLSERHPDVLLVIAGRPGAATPRLEALIAKFGLQARVLRLGARTDVPDLLTSADVFAFSSRWEGLGGSLLEAMAHRVPIVAFDIPPVRETTGGHAVLLPLDDVEGFAEAMRHVLEEPTTHDDDVDRARRRVEEQYSPSQVVLRMAELYSRVAATGRTRLDSSPPSRDLG